VAIVSDVTSWSITLVSLITLLESSFMLSEEIYSSGFTYDYHNHYSRSYSSQAALAWKGQYSLAYLTGASVLKKN